MNYSKKYPITHLPNEFLILEWERGYKNISIFCGEREICHLDSLQKIKKGFSFIDDQLGKIELKLSDKPIAIDIIVNGFHSSVNNSHPSKKIKGISMYFYMFATFSVLYCVITSLSLTNFFQFVVYLVLEAPFIALYIICGIFAKKSKIWPVYTGFIVFCFFTLVTLLSLFLPFASTSVFFSLLMLVFKSVFIVFMIPFVKAASELIKYKKNRNFSNQQIIDDI
jgi:hypothetical protein